MGKIVTGFSVSLDGYVAGPNDSREKPLGEGGEPLFGWYFNGDTEFRWPSGSFVGRVSKASAELLRGAMDTAGALVSGRRTFDITDGWNGQHPIGVPVFVVTHSAPRDWIREHGGDQSPIRFVTDGLESALEQARAAAGDKSVIAGSPSIAKQCLRAGILDEIEIDLVPLLLGGGVRLFEQPGPGPMQLRLTGVVEGSGVTHLGYSAVRSVR